MLLKHCLDQGVSKAELSRRLGVSRRTIHHWIATGRLDRDLAAGRAVVAPRQRRKHKLDPCKGIVDARLEEFPRVDRSEGSVMRCAFWQGGSAHGSEAPAFEAGGDRYHVYEGPETRILDWMVRRADAGHVAGDYDCPSFLWPSGRTWCISTPFHSSFALVGAPLRVIEYLLRIPGLYATRTAANDPNPGGSG